MPFGSALLAALLTAFYSWRVAFMTFHGPKHWQGDHGHADHHHDDHAHGHHAHEPHESPLTMLIPIIVLAVGAIGAGFVFAPYFLGEHSHAFWGHAIFTAPTNHILHESHEIKEVWVKWAPLFVTVTGSLVAAYVYLLKPGLGKRMAANQGPLYTFFYNKWFFDELYQATFVRLTKGLGDLFWKIGDIKIIDGLGPNGAAWGVLKAARNLVKTQSGYVYHYAFFMFLGVVGLLTYVFWWTS